MIRDISLLMSVGILFLYALSRMFVWSEDNYERKDVVAFVRRMMISVTVLCLLLFGIGIVEVLYILTRTFWPI